MTEHNVFTKKHTEEVTQAKRTLLDELNLPPRATTYIRENFRFLLAMFLLVILSICGRSYYIHYTTTKIDNSTGALAQAIIIEDADARIKALQVVYADHSGTGAANWAVINLAKEYISQKKYDDAITSLQAEISLLDGSDPNFIPCKLLLAYSYEESNNTEQALVLYNEIRMVHEYMVVGTISTARIYEKLGKKPEAIDAYENASASPTLSQAEKDWLKDRIRHLSVT